MEADGASQRPARAEECASVLNDYETYIELLMDFFHAREREPEFLDVVCVCVVKLLHARVLVTNIEITCRIILLLFDHNVHTLLTQRTHHCIETFLRGLANDVHGKIILRRAFAPCVLFAAQHPGRFSNKGVCVFAVRACACVCVYLFTRVCVCVQFVECVYVCACVYV